LIKEVIVIFPENAFPVNNARDSVMLALCNGHVIGKMAESSALYIEEVSV